MDGSCRYEYGSRKLVGFWLAVMYRWRYGLAEKVFLEMRWWVRVRWRVDRSLGRVDCYSWRAIDC